MQESLITFETAKLAREKGFYLPESSTYYYNTVSGCLYKIKSNLNKRDIVKLSAIVAFAPTQSLMQKWLREVHNIHIDIESDHRDNPDDPYTFYINYMKGSFWTYYEEYPWRRFTTYEEALEAGLQQALNLI